MANTVDRENEYDLRMRRPQAARVYDRIKRSQAGKPRGFKPPPISRQFHARPVSKGPAAKQFTRRAVVRVGFTKNGRSGDTWAKHGRYLEREGAQKEGEKGIGFDRASDEVSLSATLGQWQRAGEPRLFKFTLSPEDGDRLNLREYTRDFMQRVERTVGKPMEWAAIEHYNTDNPHVHIAIRGTRDLRISPHLARQGLRGIASEIATERLGYRSELEVLHAREKDIDRRRFTQIDRDIQTKTQQREGDRHHYITEPMPAKAREQDMVSRRLRIARLTELEKLGVADKLGAMTWRLEPGWDKALKEMEVLRTRTKMLAQSRALMTDPRCQPTVTRLQPGERLVGRVLGKGFDEGRDQTYLMLEGTDSRAHIVYLSKLTEVKTRELVALESKSFEKDGKQIGFVETKGYNVQIPDTGWKKVDLPAKALDDELKARERAGRPAPSKDGPSAGFAAHWHKKLLERARQRRRGIEI